jgi:hypothetical protein
MALSETPHSPAWANIQPEAPIGQRAAVGWELAMVGPDNFSDLIQYLQSCVRSGASAELTPGSVELLLAAIRSLDPRQGGHLHPFEIVAYDGATEEILGQASTQAIADVIFAKAAASEPDRKIILRSGSAVLKSSP